METIIKNRGSTFGLNIKIMDNWTLIFNPKLTNKVEVVIEKIKVEVNIF